MFTRSRRWLLACVAAAVLAAVGLAAGWGLRVYDPAEAARRRVPLGASAYKVAEALGRDADGAVRGQDRRGRWVTLARHWDYGSDSLVVDFDRQQRATEAVVVRGQTLWDRVRDRVRDRLERWGWPRQSNQETD
jgi:hypothetical protein